LLEGFWFKRIDRQKPFGKRVINPDHVAAEGTAFFQALLSELRLREPAIPFDTSRFLATRNQIDERVKPHN
jgi:hypothetical protein